MNFTCDGCGGTFPNAWSEEDAIAERDRAFPEGIPPEEQAALCHDCWLLVRSWDPELDRRYQ